MRMVMVGAGAVGGVIAARLIESGADVALVARGAHAEAMRRDGLTLIDPDRTITVPVRVLNRVGDVGLRPDDLIGLAVKGQDTEPVLDELAGLDVEAPIACFQNGVANERNAARRFATVLGVVVMLPAVHRVPGRVEAYSSPIPGLFDVGRYPSGSDAVCERLVALLAEAGFDARVVPDVMRWKYTKLLMNVGNAVEALCGLDRDGIELVVRARNEAREVFDRSGIEYATDDEERARRGSLLQPGEIGGHARPGGSSWQSLARGTGTIEAEYLNGEIVRLGRNHGIATPVNELVLREAVVAAADRVPPASVPAATLLARLDASLG
ncbi:MAG: ketopantoate reductase family protein [Acidimicrobiia bacterium]|nr:ketopantoate reductase family protein [Acidimicrobiia bacterium]